MDGGNLSQRNRFRRAFQPNQFGKLEVAGPSPFRAPGPLKPNQNHVERLAPLSSQTIGHLCCRGLREVLEDAGQFATLTSASLRCPTRRELASTERTACIRLNPNQKQVLEDVGQFATLTSALNPNQKQVLEDVGQFATLTSALNPNQKQVLED